LSFLNGSIDYEEASPLITPTIGEKRPPITPEKTSSLQRKQKRIEKYKKQIQPRKENASLSLRRKIKAKNRECKNHWERKYISPSASGKEFPLANPFLLPAQ